MGLFDFITKREKNKPLIFPARFQQTFLQRVGIVNSYDDNIRTYIERGYQQNPVVYSIVNMISKNAGRAIWCVKDANGEEVAVPVLDQLMTHPNPLQSWTDFIQDAITHKIIEGNTFITGEYGSGLNSSKYSSLYILPSEDTQIIAYDDFKGISGYRVDFAWSENSEIPATEVLHLKNPNPDFDETDNWLFGQSNFRAASKSIQTYNESLDTGVWFLQNKGSQKILFNEDPDIELGPEGTDSLKRKLRAQAQGSKNSANIPIIDSKLGVIDISSDAQSALVLEQRDQAAMEICNVVNFPGQLMGLNDATYQNAKEAKKALWENVIIPELNELKDGLNRWLAPQFGDVYLDYKIDHIDALQEDRLTRGKAIKEYAGMITINEARELAGFKPVETIGEFNGDDLYVGFTQAVVSDSEEISDQNNDDNETD